MSTTTSQPPATQPATVPASQVIPFPLPWGSIPGCAPGCVPAGGMDALMKCYMDIKAAMAFISKVMIDLINNDPAVAQAMIDAIVKSGAALPLIGVTNGADVQPGQVGQWVQMGIEPVIPIGQFGPISFGTVGVLPPGDWDYWAVSTIVPGAATTINAFEYSLDPLPAGFSWDLNSFVTNNQDDQISLVSGIGRALTSEPSLIAFTGGGNSDSGGPVNITFFARRMR